MRIRLTSRDLAVGLVALLWLSAPAAAGAQPTIKIVPPRMSGGTGAATTVGDRQPTFGVEVSGMQQGDEVRCGFDSPTLGSCGPPVAGCSAPFCASGRPAAPLTGTGYNSGHAFYVQVVDGDDNVLAHAEFDFSVDLTPPNTRLGPDALGGLDPFRPQFAPQKVEDDPYENDTLQCSLVPLGSPPAWTRCHGVTLPRKRRDYRFETRTVDALGRPDPTPAVVDFNPVPCQATPRRVTIATLATAGLPVKLDCHYIRRVNVGFWLRGSFGRSDPLGLVSFKTRRDGKWKAAIRIPVARSARAWVRHQHALALSVYVTPLSYGSPSSAGIVVHR